MFEKIKHKWIISFLIVLLSFTAVCLFLFPIFNSGDDVFLLYTLSGGYGEAPTNLLHYNHIWHPALGWVVKSLFEASPGINWYTVFLLSAQITGCVAMLYVLLKRFRLLNALILYFLFFFFIEIRILLSLNFSSSAWVLAAGGYVLMLETILRSKSKWNFLIACLFLIIAGLLRLHILLAVAFLFSPCFLFFAYKQYKIWGTAAIIIAGLLFLLNQQHQHYYKKYIPGWQQQENFRQSLFRYKNNPVDPYKVGNDVFIDNTEKAFYVQNFFYDTMMFTPARVEQIGIALANKRKHSLNENLPGLYWLFIELRVYILLLIVCLFLAWQFGVLKIIIHRWLPLSAFALGVYLILGFFYKITPTLHTGFLLVIWLYAWWAFPVNEQITTPGRSKFYFLLLLFFPFAWMGIRIIKNDRENREKYQRFKCAVKEFQQNEKKLFIATDDALPLGFFYIWDTPVRYKIMNLIYKDRIITYSYKTTLHRFDIKDIMHAIYNDPRVFLVGKELPELLDYYQQKGNDKIYMSEELPGYKCLKVRKIIQKTD